MPLRIRSPRMRPFAAALTLALVVAIGGALLDAMHARVGAMSVTGITPTALALTAPAGTGTSWIEPDAITSLPETCAPGSGAAARAADILLDRYQLGASPVVTLPHDLTWREDPFHDENWQFRLHSLEMLPDLLATFLRDGDARLLDRAKELAQDWATDNPVVGAPSPYSWNDHSTAIRGINLACLADTAPTLVRFRPGGPRPWLNSVLSLHGAVLADPAFYRREGNHALNQAISLLEIGRVLRRSDWRALAASRIESLVTASIDAEGVTNEQSVQYHSYNWRRYLLAERRLIVAGLTPSSAFDRVDSMPGFLLHATRPDGLLEQLGDTSRTRSPLIPGTPNEYASTVGASGPRPDQTVKRYTAGFLFARTGWGETRAPIDETFMSLRFGPAPIFHGHADGGSLTLYGWSSSLLVDAGLHDYNPGPWRTYFKGRSAHNVVTVDGATWKASATTLLGSTIDPSMVFTRVRLTGYAGVTETRSVVFSRVGGYVLVEDRLNSTTAHTYRQLWHLVDDAKPTLATAAAVSHRPRGNILLRDVSGGARLDIVKGATSPIQGWQSYDFGTMVANPVVRFSKTATSARFLTLLATAPDAPTPVVTNFVNYTDGYRVDITTGDRTERITVHANVATVVELG